MHLLAMERKEFEKRAKEDPTLKWFTDKTGGVLRANVVSPSTVVSVLVREAPVTTYRVALQDGKLTAEMVGAKKSSSAVPPMAGIAVALSLMSFGIWFARRR
jgi:hypothetical protein